MSTAHRTVIALCAGLLTSLASPAGADLHAYWDARCHYCHGESGPFARSTLRVDAQGRLRGWHHGADLERFLRQHYLADELVHPVSAMLAAQVVTPPLFRQRSHGGLQPAQVSEMVRALTRVLGEIGGPTPR